MVRVSVVEVSVLEVGPVSPQEESASAASRGIARNVAFMIVPFF
jgi:hypothetical protein